MTEALDPFTAQIKARLLPLSPLGKAMEWLVERLPRRLIRIVLKPTNDIEAINESKGEYKAISKAPSFEMMFMSASPQGGWYYLEAALVRNNGSREASIRADIRDEYIESITLPIPTNLRGTVREVFYLPCNVTALYWLPTTAPGFFSQSQFLLHKISPVESTLRRLCRVLFDLWRFRSRTPATRAGLTWWGAISNLQDAYRRTAVLRINRMMGIDYSTFILLNDNLKKTEIRAMRKQAHQLPFRPIITLVMPVQIPSEDFFRAALDSVVGQIYPHWELLLAGDFSEGSQNLAIANEYRNKKAQVKIVLAKPGSDLTEKFNSALELAQGEFVARINQHDQIPPHALLLLAKEINKHPEVDLIYTDEDSIDDTCKRLDPRFKPDWNPELFFSHNYLTNLILYRQARVLELGGYRPGFEGAEDYDLSLRYLRDIPTIRIRHIAKVLYHVRATSQPVEFTPLHLHGEYWGEVKGSAHQSGKRALAAYFVGTGAIVEDGPAAGLYHLKHPLPVQPPLVSIIIPTRDRVEILKACIESIQQKTDYENWEVLIIDNQSEESATHAYFEQMQSDKRIKLICYNKPFNYSALNNFAVQYAQGEILALLNNDVEVITKDWLSEMVGHAIRPEIGAVGAKLLYSNGTVQHAGVILGIGGVAGHAHKYLKGGEHGYCHRAVVAQNLSAVTGACLIVRKSSYIKVGGLNEVNLKVAFNDIDFCLKLVEAGYRNVFTPHARLYHHESISRGHNDTPEKHALFVREVEYMKNKWGKRLKQDPAYNFNLTREFEDYSLTYQ